MTRHDAGSSVAHDPTPNPQPETDLFNIDIMPIGEVVVELPRRMLGPEYSLLAVQLFTRSHCAPSPGSNRLDQLESLITELAER